MHSKCHWSDSVGPVMEQNPAIVHCNIYTTREGSTFQSVEAEHPEEYQRLLYGFLWHKLKYSELV